MAEFVYRPSSRHNHLLAKEQEGFAVFWHIAPFPLKQVFFFYSSQTSRQHCTTAMSLFNLNYVSYYSLYCIHFNLCMFVSLMHMQI